MKIEKWLAIMTVSVACYCSVGVGGEIAELQKAGVVRRTVDTTPETIVDESQHGITEVGLERTPCIGACPVYTVIIKSDGGFRYDGEANVERIGKHTGKIPKWKFNRLANFLRESGYSDLADRYEYRATDMSTTYTTAVVDGNRKTVENYGNSGPGKLWAIQELIDRLLADAEWDEQPATKGASKPSTRPLTNGKKD